MHAQTAQALGSINMADSVPASLAYAGSRLWIGGADKPSLSMYNIPIPAPGSAASAPGSAAESKLATSTLRAALPSVQVAAQGSKAPLAESKSGVLNWDDVPVGPRKHAQSQGGLGSPAGRKSRTGLSPWSPNKGAFGPVSPLSGHKSRGGRSRSAKGSSGLGSPGALLSPSRSHSLGRERTSTATNTGESRLFTPTPGSKARGQADDDEEHEAEAAASQEAAADSDGAERKQAARPDSTVSAAAAEVSPSQLTGTPVASSSSGSVSHVAICISRFHWI
jgi:hypothetical protein